MATLLVLWVYACGGDHQGRLVTTGQGGDGIGGFTSGECDPPCHGTKFCSVNGTCLEPGQCGGEDDCPASANCVAGECTGCTPPNLLLAIDRSCSMTGLVGGRSKWSLAVSAINGLMTDHAGEFAYGLTMFPDIEAPDCDQGAAAVPVGPDREAEIEALLTASLSPSNQYFPDDMPCVTNIDAAMAQAAAEPAFDNGQESFVLLLTDGKQTGCSSAGGDAGTLQTITDLWEQRSIGTFVVGFGGGIDQTQMNQFADAGGVPTNDLTCSPQPCRFYQADDGGALAAALDVIAEQVGCNPMIR
jgi:hypothetical protein